MLQVAPPPVGASNYPALPPVGAGKYPGKGQATARQASFALQVPRQVPGKWHLLALTGGRATLQHHPAVPDVGDDQSSHPVSQFYTNVTQFCSNDPVVGEQPRSGQQSLMPARPSYNTGFLNYRPAASQWSAVHDAGR